MAQQNDNPYRQPGPALSESRGFRTVDLWTNPQDQTGDMLLAADNTVNRAGTLYVRPGMKGMFGGSAPSSSSSSSSSHNSSSSSSSSSSYNDIGGTYYGVLPNPVYDLCDFTDSLGDSWMLLTSGGKLYKTRQGSGSYTELLDTSRASYSFNSPITDASRIGDYAYIDDSEHVTVRVSLSGGFPAYAMIAPADSPTVSLSSIAFDSPTSAQWFTGPTPLNQNSLISNGYFDVTGASSGNVYLPGSPWTVGGGKYVLPTTSPDYGPFSFTDGHSQQHITGHNYSLLLDNPADGVQQPFSAPYNQSIPWPDPNALTKSACFLFSCQGLLQTSGSQAAVAVTVTAYDAGNNPITSQTQVLYPSSAFAFSQMSAVFNFTQALISDPDHYMLAVSSGPKNVGSNGIWLAAVTLIPFADGPILSDAGGSQVRWSAPYAPIGGTYIVRDYGTGGKDFSNVGTLGMKISSGIPLADLFIRFGFVQTASSSSSSSHSAGSSSSSSSGAFFPGPGAIEWSNDISFNTDGTFAFCDITTIDPAVLASVRFLFIQVVLDLPAADISPGSAPNLLTFGPFSATGQLTQGQGDYTYYITETAVIDSFNHVQSNPSAPSATISPSVSQAEAVIVIPADCKKNAPSTEYNLWRLGGAWSDVRLVATVQVGVSVAYGSDPANPSYSWNASARTFVDNTPDIFLAVADLMSFSRDPMPANAQCSAVWQGRLWKAVGNQLYASWLYNSDNSAALMTTLVLNLDDPNYTIAGANFPVGADPSNSIVRLIPFGTPVQAGNQFGGGLLCLMERGAPFLVQGTNSSNFSVQQYDYNSGAGLIAFRGVARISANEIVWMGGDRLHVFPPQGDNPAGDIGLRIQSALYPVQPQVLQNSTAFSKSWMLFHDYKLLLGCPQPGGLSNSVVWLYDFRIGGWTRWTGPTPSGSSSSSSSLVSSGPSLSSSSSLGVSSSSSSSSSPSGPNFTLPGMAITGGMSLPPTSNGADYDLYLYGLDGQIYRMTGTVDQYSPLSVPQAISFTITVHAMRPGFYIRYKARPLYYVQARLEWCEIEMVMNGTLTITAQAWDAGLSSPVPLPGKKSVRPYLLTGGGRAFRMPMPGGLIAGTYLTLTISGAVTDIAYCRGVRGFISGTSTEYA